MKIAVKLFATLRQGRQKVMEMELPDKTTPEDIIRELGIKKSEVAILFINGRNGQMDSALKEGDLVALFPPVGGG